MNQLLELKRRAVRERLSVIANQSDRTLLLCTVLATLAVCAVIGFILERCYAVDMLSSLLVSVPKDCFLDWGAKIGQHCFSDYGMVMGFATRPNPWELYPMYLPWDNYHANIPDHVASEMIPHALCGLLGKFLHSPQIGLLTYLLVLTVSVFTPAVWAARGVRGVDRAAVLVALGVGAIPAWMTIDRGNSVAFTVPIALVFLVALSRRRWGLVAVMVVLASLLKPQFLVLGLVLPAARQWRLTGVTLVAGVLSHLGAYLLWPRDFPATIMQSIHNVLGHGSFESRIGAGNMSFTKGILMIPDIIKASQNNGTLPPGFLGEARSLLGYVVLVLIAGSVLALGKRIPPVMAGILLLATASLFPALAAPYYLVFVLPVAALIVRDPNGPPGRGIFEKAGSPGGRRRVLGACVTVATALSIAQIPQPNLRFDAPIAGQFGATGIIGTTPLVITTVTLVPLLWLVACATIIGSYVRKPAAAAT